MEPRRIWNSWKAVWNPGGSGIPGGSWRFQEDLEFQEALGVLVMGAVVYRDSQGLFAHLADDSPDDCFQFFSVAGHAFFGVQQAVPQRSL